jgi:uridylate kinase
VTDPSARRYETLTYRQVLEQSLGVMDLTAVTLCQQNAIPIVVFDVNRDQALEQVLRGQAVGTTIAG